MIRNLVLGGGSCNEFIGFQFRHFLFLNFVPQYHTFRINTAGASNSLDKAHVYSVTKCVQFFAKVCRLVAVDLYVFETMQHTERVQNSSISYYQIVCFENRVIRAETFNA